MRFGTVRVSLRSKLVVAYLLVLLPILGLIIYDYLADYRQREESVLAGESWTAQALGTVVDDTFDQAVAVGRALAADPLIQSLDSDRLDPYLGRYLSVYPHYLSINVWDAQGRSVATALPTSPREPSATIADRSHFQAAVATGMPAISDVILARVGGVPSVAIAVPIRSSQDAMKGVLTITLDLKELPARLQSVRLNPGQEMFVADTSGRLALRTDAPDLAWEERTADDYAPIREALSRYSFSGVVDRSLGGDPRLVASVRTPRYGWIAGVSLGTEVALAPNRQYLLAKLALYGLVALVAIAMAVAFTYTITRPLSTLNRTILAFGQGDLERRANISTGDELETTAQTFNQMADALQEEQTRLQTLLETAPVGVIVAEIPGGRETLMNQMATELLGVNERPSTGVDPVPWHSKLKILRPDGRPYPPGESPLARALLLGEPVQGEEMIVGQPSGKQLYILVHATPLVDGSGRPVEGIAVFQDITGLKEIQRQLEELGQAREEFISVVAHDLRSPLTVIRGFASYLARMESSGAPPNRHHRALENILSSTERLERMIEDLLDISRIEARRLKVIKEPLDLAALVRDVVERLQSTTDRHTFRIEAPEEIPILWADPARVEQVLTNLLGNAVKYSDPHTEILVRLAPALEEVMVSVTNQGPGIPPEEQEAVFGRFRRTEATTRSRISGLGLGLYICKGLVEAHGGRIWVVSEPGKQTAFTFTLPTRQGIDED